VMRAKRASFRWAIWRGSVGRRFGPSIFTKSSASCDPTRDRRAASSENFASAVDQTQMQQVYTLKIKGETIGAWAGEPVMPGVNFSWAPSPLRLLMFAKREGGPLVVVDESGRKQELKGARAALLPAWSSDGTRVAWLERKDKKRLELTIADVSTPQ